MTSESKSRVAARMIEQKTRELVARASFIADQDAHGGASDFDIEMLRDSASAVDFWTSELVKAVAK